MQTRHRKTKVFHFSRSLGKKSPNHSRCKPRTTLFVLRVAEEWQPFCMTVWILSGRNAGANSMAVFIAGSWSCGTGAARPGGTSTAIHCNCKFNCTAAVRFQVVMCRKALRCQASGTAVVRWVQRTELTWFSNSPSFGHRTCASLIKVRSMTKFTDVALTKTCSGKT